MKKPQLIIYTPQEYNHASYIHTGLFQLKKEGVVDVKVKLYTQKNIGHTVTIIGQGSYETVKAFDKVSLYRYVDNNTNSDIRFAIDLYDLENRFPTKALELCDVVFKRSYNTAYINELPEAYRNKLRPFGLTMPLYSKYAKQSLKMYLGLMLNTLRLNLKKDSHNIKRVTKAMKTAHNEWHHVKKTRGIERFDVYSAPKKISILFQTRCFPHENNKDVKAIHQQRYSIIIRLKTEFPQYFQGGFIPSKIAEAKFADALSNVPSDQTLYLQALKDAKIVVYTRGLSNSPAWKLAEYLSQAKVILAEPLSTELPEGLVHGKHLLFFNTLEELINHIKELMGNKMMMQTLSEGARHYYETQIKPSSKMLQLLKRIKESVNINEN